MSGHFTTRTAIIFLVMVMSVIGGCLSTSWMLYESCNIGPPYSVFIHQISYLGDPEMNPCGAFLFTVALWTLAIAAIPLVLFYRRALAALKAKVAGVFAFFFGLSIPAMFAVGIVPSSLDPYVHLVTAAVAFGGAGLAYLLSGIGLITNKIHDHNEKIPIALVIPFLAYIIFITFGIAVQIYAYVEGLFYSSGETLLSFTLWEWLLFIAILGICVATTFPLIQSRGSQASPNSTKRSV